MTVSLAPDCPQVDPCKILNLVVKRENGTLIHKQYLTVVAFDYGELLEEIRQKDIIKSDDILYELGKMLIERKYVLPADAYVLDLGVTGRVSTAVQDLYKHKLNGNHCSVKRAIRELSHGYFEFEGPEGTLPVLMTESQEVAGHVYIDITDGTGMQEHMTLDVVGPADVDFPDDFKEQLHERFMDFLSENHPEVNWKMKVNVSRSDYCRAMESRHHRSKPSGVRYVPCDWIAGV